VTDTLRDRIAALLELLRPVTPREDADAVIDAVIKDLGLFQQFLVDGIISDGEPRPWEMPCETRWTTEWSPYGGDMRDRIVAVQAEHIDRQLTNYDTGREECGCGNQGCASYREHLADAVLADLRAAGYAIVELPKPDEGRDDWLDGGVHLTHDGYVMHEEDDDGGHTCYTAGEARDLAAALLAAAEYAERDQ